MTLDEMTINSLFSCDVPYLVDLFASCTYPWELLPRIKALTEQLVRDGLNGFTKYADNVLVGRDVKIYPNVVFDGPCVIGHNCELRPGAFLRGSIITGEKCVIGNSTELKNCILLNHVDVPHYNYVGDAVLGNYAHLGAGSVCSNLKGDKSNVVIHGDVDVPTGLRKCGAIVGDGTEVGCHCVLNPGTVIGRSSRVYPMVSVRGTIPANVLVKESGTFVPLH